MELSYKDWLVRWIEDKRNYVKHSTYANYSNHIYSYIIPYLGKYKIDELNHKIIQEFILELSQNGRLRNNEGLSNKTIKDIVMIVKSSLVAAANENLISLFNLRFYYPTTTNENKMAILTPKEQEMITTYVMENMTYRNLGILLSLYTGMRIGEVCALRWKDIDFSRGIIMVNRTLQRVYVKSNHKSKVCITPPKTRNSRREIPLSDNLLDLLFKMKLDDEWYVVNEADRATEPRTYRRYYDRVLKAVGIPHSNYHSLRHTFATNCISQGIDYKTVSELLGHSNINITLNLYVHPNMEEKKRCIELISTPILK